ncbi:MAG TPA: bifunctional 2-polyprenyl-6-hydroxyphenol methylase/3-demethylubiquinol 3-O-methyltransferase UbiG [Kofleriaceae bacterium]|nr:bifunctional 2-polyprenyl-6-hydroxyphenol methylase/3-demethylubiquinol 3-O-methyltransferase UbiG [Kofleriaceae bacterium]
MMLVYCMIPVVLQGLAMVVDEGWFHRARGLPRWERIGHPLDTLTLAVCLAWLVAMPPGAPSALPVYLALAVISTLFITKDEAVHARRCSPGEHWLHAVLFALHPIVLAAFAYLWWTGAIGLLIGQLALVLGFMAYQVIYWNIEGGDAELARPAQPVQIDNTWYADLGGRWYSAQDTPIALLRAESRHRNPWIADELARAFDAAPCRVLDLGCGGGFLANYLAERGHDVVGIDSTAENLTIARAHDRTGRVRYEVGDACALRFPPASFDVVCALDLLEHVEDPERVIAEAGRVLAPGGLFVFHTFNRTWQAQLIVIKGVAWFVRNAPPDLHVLRMFVTPDEVRAMCRAHGFDPPRLRGSRPRFGWPLWRMVLTGKVGDDFAFTTARSTKLGYTGIARRRDVAPAATRSTGSASRARDPELLAGW